jgi:hypothetical protein
MSAMFVLGAAVAVGAYAVMLQRGGNFHTVIAGEIYRSAQAVLGSGVSEWREFPSIESAARIQACKVVTR